MATVLKHWREAATLVLVTSSKLNKGVAVQLTLESKPTADVDLDPYNLSGDRPPPHDGIDSNLDVLMLRRSSKSTFMPNLHVFPGGVAVDSDFSRHWITVFDKLGTDVRKHLFQSLDSPASTKYPPSPMFTRDRGEQFSHLPPEVAFRLCAIRETFEESGVLIARPVKDVTRQFSQTANASDLLANEELVSAGLLQEDQGLVDKWRSKVNQNPQEFLTMCLELELIPEIWSLYEWSSWLTPTVAFNKRFDTIFYVCCVDHKPEAVQDQAETVHAMWASPYNVLSAYFNQIGGLAPPQVIELARLLNFSTASDVLRFMRQPGRERVERWMPVVAKCKDTRLSFFQGDDLYPAVPDLVNPGIVDLEETMEELNVKYPRHFRMVHDPRGFDYPLQNIRFREGHVGLRCDITDRLRQKAKPKI